MKRRIPINRSVVVVACALILILWPAAGTCKAAIVYPAPPKGGWEMAYDRASSDDLARGFPNHNQKMEQPYLAYFAQWNEVLAGHLLAGAKPLRWRYVITDGKKQVATVVLDMADAKTGQTLDVNSVEQGYADEVVALRAAQKLPQVQKSDYEVRYLACMYPSFVALWLHGKSDDILIPMELTFGRFEVNRPYTEDQIIKVLQPEAERHRKWQLAHPGVEYDD